MTADLHDVAIPNTDARQLCGLVPEHKSLPLAEKPHFYFSQTEFHRDVLDFVVCLNIRFVFTVVISIFLSALLNYQVVYEMLK